MQKAGYILIFLLSAGALVPEAASAQFWGLGLSGDSRFSRQLDAVNWDFSGNYAYHQPNLDLQLLDGFSRRFYFLNGYAQNIQNQNLGHLAFTKWEGTYWGYGLRAQSFSYTNTHVRQVIATAGPVFRWPRNWQLAPGVGFMTDRRNDHTDNGVALSLNAFNPGLQVGEVTLKPDFSAQYANIRPRQYHLYRLNTTALYHNEDVHLHAHLNLGESKQGSYQPGSYLNRDVNNVMEMVVSDSSELAMDLDFPIWQNLKGDLNFSTQTNVRRFINNPIGNQTSNDLFDSRFIHRELDLTFTSTYRFGLHHLSGGFDYELMNMGARLINTGESADITNYTIQQEARQRAILSASNFNQSQFALFTQNTIVINTSNILRFGGRIGILHYNTPETTDDDHDILTFLFNLSENHRFTDYLNGSISFSGQAFHNVYIYSSRSSENNWRRSLRLVPVLEWKPTDWLSIHQQFLLRANYTVYDYTLQGQPTNDQASREWGIRTEARIQAAPDWFFSLSGSRNELRIGQLYWKVFKEVPLDTLVTWTGEATITHQKGLLTVTAGMRIFLKHKYLPSTELQAVIPGEGGSRTISWTAPGRQTTIQWGPVVTISLPLKDGNELYLDGWIQQQAINRKQYTRYPSDEEAVFRRAARHWSRQMYPNLTLNARFHF